MTESLSLVIPLWNEEKNIPSLIESIQNSGLSLSENFELILVNNGSQDQTGYLIDQAAKTRPWIHNVHLDRNLNYGGGIQVGIEKSKNNFVGFIPGDLQVAPSDVVVLWETCLNMIKNGQKEFLVKGFRAKRYDGISIQFVSFVYTFLANLILKIHTKDLNALPKIFNKSLYFKIHGTKINTFVFDAQMMLTAKQQNTAVYELPVMFHARREGVSSWSGKRMKVYFQSFRLLLKLRRENY
ncbi:MAG: glycosyltransferase family 2 protein [Bdellovibrionales bacterium]|nr:glycosyltransferase family 2 protein [Bdellovibrionales bacterium]